MGTMIPLGSVLGWIFAVLGALVLIFCYASALAGSSIDSDSANKFQWIFAIALVALVVGVIFIVKYWIGGV